MLTITDRHEPPRGAPWSEAAAREAIAAIVADLHRQFDPATLWPVHPRDAEPGDAPVPNPMLYNGAAGVVWALRRLAGEGGAVVDLDLAAIAVGLHEHARRWIDAHASEEPSYSLGLGGVRMLQWSFDRSPATADALYLLVEANLHNPALEALWGSPGTLVAALHMIEATGGEPRWLALFRRGVDLLWEQMTAVRHGAQPDREVFIWTQQLYGMTLQHLGAGHGFAGNLFPIVRGARWLDPAVVAAFEARAFDTLDAVALRDPARPGQANWEPTFDRAASGRASKPLMQDCHGAPGIVCRLAGARSAPLQALLREGAEAVWQAGPLVKRPGLCHGTDGNGYAFLKLHALTGEAHWLDRARAFAMHALRQSNELAAEHGRRVPSLWTGDAGLAIYLDACVRADPALPTLDVF